MCRVNAFVRIANFVTLIAWLSACSGQAPAPPEPSPTPTDAEQISLTGTPASQELPPTATPLPTWDYIAIGGDFTYAQNWDQFYADYMAEDLGIPVAFSDLSSHSSLTLKGWLEQIQADSELHKALQEAEAVTFDVPIEAYLQMPIAMYQNRLCGGEDGEDCYRERVEELRQDLEAFLAELTALADPTQVLVRTVLRGAIPAYQGEGVGESYQPEFTEDQMRVLIKYLLASDELIRQAVAAHGIQAADLPAVLQPGGADTAPDEQYLLMLGLSEAGDKVVADLLRQEGYEPSPQAEVVLTEDGCTVGVYANPVPNPVQVRVENRTDLAAALVVVTLKEGASRYDLLESAGGGAPAAVEKIVAHPEPGPNNEMNSDITLEEGRENYFVCAQPDNVLAVPVALIPGQSYQPFPLLRAVREVPYTRPVSPSAQEFKLDIYSSQQQGSLPVVVFLHGSNTPKDDPMYVQLFENLATTGAVVYSAQSFEGSGGEMARSDQGAGIRHDHENAACAVRYARATAVQYGGDPQRVILIGHSGGGYTGLWVTLAGDILEQAWGALGAETPQQQVECVAGGDLSPVPDGYIGYNGALVYFDQMRSEFPALYKVLDPRSYAGRNTNVPLLFIFGDQDFSYVNLPWFKKGVDELSAMLEAAGNDLQFELWPGIGHNVDTRSVPLFPTAFEILLERTKSSTP